MAFTVAIDGPAAAGKGTISRAVAAHFGFAHLDTGLLYRAVGARLLAGDDPVQAAQTLDPGDLAADLRSPAVADAASRVAVIPGVRAALLEFQRDFARGGKGAVLDGRDIGTVICPGAEVKLFITASPAVRAMRRHAELGGALTMAQVLADVLERDERDVNRAAAPLKPAADAVLIDTTDLTIEAAIRAAIAVIGQRLG